MLILILKRKGKMRKYVKREFKKSHERFLSCDIFILLSENNLAGLNYSKTENRKLLIRTRK